MRPECEDCIVGETDEGEVIGWPLSVEPSGLKCWNCLRIYPDDGSGWPDL